MISINFYREVFQCKDRIPDLYNIIFINNQAFLIVGCPREIKSQENRVGLTPSGVRQLTGRGVQVIVQSSAGIGAAFSDEEYLSAGATTHADPVFIEEGVVHCCVDNMPGVYARTSTQALTNVTIRYVERLATLGLSTACEYVPELSGGINVHEGQITCREVAEAHGLPWKAVSEVA